MIIKYSLEERLEIGRRIYVGELTKYTATVEYDISYDSARTYMRLYRDKNSLPPRFAYKSLVKSTELGEQPQIDRAKLMRFRAMNKKELFDALVEATAELERIEREHNEK